MMIIQKRATVISCRRICTANKLQNTTRDALIYQRALGGRGVPELLPNQRQQSDAEVFKRDRKSRLRDEVRRDYGSPEYKLYGNPQGAARGLIDRECGDSPPDRHSMSSVD